MRISDWSSDVCSSDLYGGCLDNRLRFPLEVFAAMRAAWPADRPMSVRISATDWMGDAGITPDESVAIARAFRDAGADLIDVSAGQTWSAAQPVRSEEHTSELQSIMRISYAVFCLKQKKRTLRTAREEENTERQPAEK